MTMNQKQPNPFGGNDSLTLELMLRTLEDAESRNDPTGSLLQVQLLAVTGIVDIYTKYNIHREAEVFINRELDIRRKLREPELEINKARIILALCFMRQEKYAASEALFTELKEYFEINTPKGNALNTVYQYTLQLYMSMAKYDKALELIEEIKDHMQRHGFPKDVQDGVILNLEKKAAEARKKEQDKSVFMNLNFYKPEEQ